MQSTPERRPCGTCGKECSVNADGTVRHHLTDNPDWQAGPDSRKCKGAGQPPATAAGVALAEDMETGQPQCRLCKHPVVLTGNGRARSHLTPEATPRPCPGGSDFPLGQYPDMVGTTDGLVATLRAECEHVPVGQCYACYGAAVPGVPVGDGDGTEPKPEPRESITRTGTNNAVVAAAPWGVDAAAVQQPTMADQLKATPLTEALARETRGVGTVLDAMDDDTRAEAERFMAIADAGLVIAGRGKNGRPYCGECNTDNHRCPGCGTSVPHGVVACAECTARVDAEKAARQAACTHPDGFRDTLSIDGREVPACEHCDAVGWFTPPASKLPQGETEDGRPCDHTDGVFGVEDGRMVCVACGMPCTHPDGFTENDPVEDDGEGLILRCGLCGAVDSGDEETHVVTDDSDDPEHADDCPGCPDPELPNCPHPETHRAGCGCPDDDSQDPAAERPDPSVRLGDLDEGDHFIRRGTLMRLTERESSTSVLAVVVGGPYDGRTGELKNPNEMVERAPAPADAPVRVGDLEVGDHFVRRGVVMRVTDTVGEIVYAVVIDGPYKGRKGELPDSDETVERTHCRHHYIYADDGQFGHSGTFCDYCGAGQPATETTTEQETTGCTDETTQPQRPASSAASTPTTTGRTTVPAPGSPQRTKVSVPAVSPKSESVTSSAPTARVAGRDRSAAVTTDQASAAAAFLGSGRPAAPTGQADQSAAAAQFLAGGSGAHGEKETKRDRYGRYLIPHPDTGKEKAWTRSTTFAKSISDTYALSQWGLRMCLLGATMRPDIVRRAHGKHVREDKKLLDELTAELKTAAGDKVAANDGTAMHSFTEMADRAWHSPGGPRSILDQVPPDCREMVETYIRLLEETGLEPVADLIEFTVVVKQYGVAGTSDNCYRATKPLLLKIGRTEVRLEPGEYVIGDKKTGRDLDYGWQEIAIQLGTYAQGLNTAGRWDRHEEKWYPKPLGDAKVRLDVGVVVHLPVDKESEKTPTVYGIDLESGWNAAVLCERVRAWRNVRTLASPVMVSQADAPPSRPEATVVSRTTVRPPTLMDKAQTVSSRGDASAVWQEATAAGLPEAEVDKLVAVMRDRLKKLAEPAG
ncbi:hypothetical protein ACH4F6_38170 [Streptomyces sp. NPDC017936]|uniref:hypothetical protein n=1 Tax=Streptomyces sp. NPDC017936 TaxID=3365016 RepID=UPI0037BA6E74